MPCPYENQATYPWIYLFIWGIVADIGRLRPGMKKYIFIGIILLASVFRLYRLGDIPVGFHRDEAFLGYNAFSILKTGREMTGEVLPIHLRSFLYSPAGYTYAAIPTVALFGLSPFSVRLPSALFGILTIVAIYFLTRLLFSHSHSAFVSLSASAFLALSPWHINLSRTATENTLVVFLLTLATYFSLLYIQKKHFLLFFISLLAFASTYLIYQAPRAFVPLLVPVLFLYGYKSMPRGHRLPSILLTVVLIFIPVIMIVSSPTLSTRVRTVSVFASTETQLTTDESLREDSMANVPPVLSRMFHNKITAYAQTITDNYFHHFSYDFLLTDKGLPDRYRVPGFGLMYPLEAVFAIIGAAILLLNSRRLAFLLLGWVLMAPLGSALTSDDIPNLQRTLIVFPSLAIIAAYGFTWTGIQLQKSRRRTALIVFAAGVTLISTASYLHAYYVQQIYHRPWYRHEGYKLLVEEVNALLPGFTKAVITNHESSPMIFFAFYNKTDPRIIQNIWSRDRTTDLNTLPFGKYEFSKETCPVRTDNLSITPKLIGVPNVLYVNFSDCKILDPAVKELSTIKRSDGTEVFRLLSVQ